jgi:hypothetical protein
MPSERTLNRGQISGREKPRWTPGFQVLAVVNRLLVGVEQADHVTEPIFRDPYHLGMVLACNLAASARYLPLMFGESNRAQSPP